MDDKYGLQLSWRRVLIGCVVAALAVQCVEAQEMAWPASSFFQVVSDPSTSQLSGLPAASQLSGLPGGQQLSWPTGSFFQVAYNEPFPPDGSIPAPLIPLPAITPNQTSPATSNPSVIPTPPATPAPAPSQNPPPADQKFGEKPQDYSQEFLRQESVLLKPGQWQFDLGLSYLNFFHDYTNLGSAAGNIVPVDSRITRRLLLAQLDARYGIDNDWQAFVNVPFGWSNTEYSFAGFDDFVNAGGIGDINFGANWLVHKSCGQSCDPDIIATFGVTAPTANVSPLQGIIEPPNSALGQGFWFGYWNVTFIHTIDPLILFYGFGSRHGLPREFEGFNIAPGAQYLYRAGVGFAVNERVTLSGALTGSYITDPYLNDVRVAGLAMEPVTLRLAATVAGRCQRLIEPFVEFGLTPDAPNAHVGVTFTF
jgi:hypothetical protein